MINSYSYPLVLISRSHFSATIKLNQMTIIHCGEIRCLRQLNCPSSCNTIILRYIDVRHVRNLQLLTIATYFLDTCEDLKRDIWLSSPNFVEIRYRYLRGLKDRGIKMDASMMSANLAVLTTVSGHPCCDQAFSRISLRVLRSLRYTNTFRTPTI